MKQLLFEIFKNTEDIKANQPRSDKMKKKSSYKFTEISSNQTKHLFSLLIGVDCFSFC